MRALAILGPAASSKPLKLFEHQGVDLSVSANLTSDARSFGAVLVLGGDGTIHHQLPHLARTGIPLLVVPFGSGNDFARALGLRAPADSLAAWRRFCSGTNNVRDVDLGVITTDEPTPAAGSAPPGTRNVKPETLFCCIGGVGLDADANRRANAMPPWLRARGGYWLAAFAAILSFRPQTITASAPGATHMQPSMNQSSMDKSSISWMLAFANAPNYGGGMRIAPRAELDDGLLDLVRIRNAGRLRLLRCLHRVYGGTHVSMPEVEYFRAAEARIESDPPLPVYADGEPVAHTPITVTVAPRALRVIIPA
ncbi:MAG: diacylglycerol kinase [Acidobacteria bacterium]|nr:diacylglycerol kinase [Acidobacteriota bacterium]